MDVKPADTVDVVIRSDLIGDESWQASLVRTEGAIDESARQLHVIAQINDPFGRNNVGRSPIKIGQYVTAEIEGKYLSDVMIIPNNTIYQGSYVYTVEDGILRRKDIDIAWQNDAEAVVASGLKPGDELVTTSLGQVTSGIRVSVIGGEWSTDQSTEETEQAEPRQENDSARGQTPRANQGGTAQ